MGRKTNPGIRRAFSLGALRIRKLEVTRATRRSECVAERVARWVDCLRRLRGGLLAKRELVRGSQGLGTFECRGPIGDFDDQLVHVPALDDESIKTPVQLVLPFRTQEKPGSVGTLLTDVSIFGKCDETERTVE